MREGFDREIDSLLRRAARAPAAGARAGDAGASRPGAHLDADELAAFAEGALPEPARMSAVSHLSDCADCRTLAVGLTRAAGVEAELDKRAAAAASSATAAREPKRERVGWLASLFGPRALRYVAPVLAISLVAAVSFVALRSRRDGGLVSQLEPNNAASHAPVTTAQSNSSQPASEASPSSAATANANSSSNANASPNVTDELARDVDSADKVEASKHKKDSAGGEEPAGSAAPAQPESKAADADDAAPPPPPPAPAKEGSAAAGGAATAPVVIAKSTVENLPAPKSAENMKGGPPASQANDDLVSNEKSQQRGATQRGYETQTPDGSRSNRSAANNVSGGLANAAPRDDRDSRARRESQPAARKARPGQDAATEDERGASAEEARSVAGHRFRREGGAWVDVNYKSSMASTGVRRGTEEYRALVADIPEIGRVAAQLGGEVIVVVRGRSYRIR